MSSGSVPSPPDHQSSTRRILVDAYIGFVVFPILNFLTVLILYLVLSTMSPTLFWEQVQVIIAVAILGVACAVALLAHFGLRWPGFAAGLLGGYALMTVVSGGTCTFLRQPMGRTSSPFDALFLYVAALVILGGALLISSLSKSR